MKPAAPVSLVRNIFSNWVGLASAIIYSLVITPIVIRALDREAYGIWSFLNALVAYSGLLYLGIGSALIKYLSGHYAVGDRKALNRLVSVVFTIYMVLGVVAFACGLVAARPVTHLLLLDSTGELGESVALTLVMLATRLSFMFVGSVFSGVLVAQGRTDLHNAVAICGHVVRLCIVPYVVGAADPLLALALVVTVTGALEVLATAIVAFRQDRNLRRQLVLPYAGELRMLYGFGALAFVLQVADKLISYTDTAVIGVVLGASQVALYQLPLQLSEYGRIVIMGLVSVMLPHLSALYARGRSDAVRWSYERTLKATALVAVFVNVNLVALGPDFLRLWVGPAFAEQAGPILIALSIAGVAQGIAVQSQIPFCLAMGRVRFPAIVMIGEGVVNLVLSIFLARSFGIVGVAVATAIPAVAVSGVMVPLYGAGLVGVSLRRLLKRVVVPVGVFAATALGTHVALWAVIPGRAPWTLIAKFAIGLGVQAGSAWFLASDSERRFVLALMERRRRPRQSQVRRAQDNPSAL